MTSLDFYLSKIHFHQLTKEECKQAVREWLKQKQQEYTKNPDLGRIFREDVIDEILGELTDGEN